MLTEQIKTFLQKVSLSSQDTEKVLFELEKEELQAKEQAKIIVQNLKNELINTEKRLEKLLDVYLAEAISTEEYTSRKQKILTQKLELQEKIKDFEQKGLSWLGPAREFVLSLNQAAKLLSTENLSEIATFLKNIGSNHILQNRQLIFEPKIPYNLVAEPSKRGEANLTFPRWLGRQDSNLRMAASKAAALPLGYSPKLFPTTFHHGQLKRQLREVGKTDFVFRLDKKSDQFG